MIFFTIIVLNDIICKEYLYFVNRGACMKKDSSTESWGNIEIVLASMMLMDCEYFEGTIKEITREVKPSRKLVASVCHPCFDTSGELLSPN